MELKPIPKPKISEVIAMHLNLYGSCNGDAVLFDVKALEARLEAAEKVCETLEGMHLILGNDTGPLLTEWKKLVDPQCGIIACKGCPDCQGINHYEDEE